MNLTEEKSREQAAIIKSIKPLIRLLDLDYCRALVDEMLSQASRQEAMAVLNIRYSQSKNDSLRMSGIALENLCDYVDSLKECDRIKERIRTEEAQQSDIEKLFL